MSKPKIVSIFSGVGGIDSGFEKAGFDTIFASDIWQTSCDSLKLNYPSAEINCENIKDVNFREILAKHTTIDGLVGGPPCPAFSKSRFYRTEKNRGLDDEDGFLTVSNYFRAVEELSPKFFLFENVHGFVFKPHSSALEYVMEESERLGYKIFYNVLNAADFGVPQTRQRFICIGIKKEMDDFVFPEKTHYPPENKSNNSWVTAGDAIGDIDFDLVEDKAMQAGSKHKDLLRLIPPGENYLYFTEERGFKEPLFKWRSRYWSFLLKLSPDRPSWTIQASHSNNMGPFHWKNRFLRISEIKRLQSFPDDYHITGNFKDQWRQVGNAVPPLLAYVLAKQIKSLYFNNLNRKSKANKSELQL
ncbi:cytosine-specific methyltransferase [Flavobacterium noncentrifugens]|uniref:Cytosine-specific methyltransferase n=1 Tax=Flavobacterium noncentrifugens TaxID=1128970 RepID=A0A1G8SJ19_9FLAO|nr:DNA cytosine methyltransferase [Flavobacterium noncentrifugens]GEP49832.1 cytosine-specific methyltransferase [Flavobacterium noncentrifugens]SDJ28630.1 DNA (cytosine-5)-methyltransferase 1 [Flavobacterium noncentrifugens]